MIHSLSRIAKCECRAGLLFSSGNIFIQKGLTIFLSALSLKYKSTFITLLQEAPASSRTINIFLNEQCKNAMNITEFIENLKVSLADLEYTNMHGYAKGISNIFEKHLTDLKPTERPIHCSDKKRLQFYIKDEDQWKKDNEHEKIDKSIQDITMKQIKQLKEWEKKNPNYLKEEKLMMEWHSMVRSIMGGSEDSTIEKNKEQIMNIFFSIKMFYQ